MFFFFIYPSYCVSHALLLHCLNKLIIFSFFNFSLYGMFHQWVQVVKALSPKQIIIRLVYWQYCDNYLSHFFFVCDDNICPCILFLVKNSIILLWSSVNWNYICQQNILFYQAKMSVILVWSQVKKIHDCTSTCFGKSRGSYLNLSHAKKLYTEEKWC